MAPDWAAATRKIRLKGFSYDSAVIPRWRPKVVLEG
jgi:hypothetical protein